jgi:hypothetical protein
MGIRESLAKQGVRIYGPPPAKGAPKVESWIFVRRIYIRLLLFTVPLWVLVALTDPATWLWIVLGVSAVTWLQGFISVNVRIRRLRNTPPDG